MSMNVSEGFQIEIPNTFVRWGISESELIVTLSAAQPRHVTAGYYTIECVSLGGLRHKLGFHFEPRVNGRLVELEFFRNENNYPGLASSFKEFQEHLEATFGTPTSKDASMSMFTWSWRNTALKHFIQERFGPEEYVRLRWFGAMELRK
jgi:hypothetical protein